MESGAGEYLPRLMIRAFFVEFVFPLLLFLFLRSVIRNVLQGFRGKAQPQPAARRAPTVTAGGELKKDPVCGTYVSTAVSLTRNVGGQVVYFCSKECRDKYRAA
jgi:YHS domain-containing protein